MLFFFFQAEDGIRDADVTGVQTCALPISSGNAPVSWSMLPCLPLFPRSGGVRPGGGLLRHAPRSGRGPAPASVKHFADLARERLRGGRLLEKGRLRLQHAVLNIGVVRIPRNVKDLHV